MSTGGGGTRTHGVFPENRQTLIRSRNELHNASALRWTMLPKHAPLTFGESEKRGNEDEEDGELMAHGKMIRLQTQIHTSSQNFIKV